MPLNWLRDWQVYRRSACLLYGTNWRTGAPQARTYSSDDARQPSRTWAAKMPGAYVLRHKMEQRRFNQGIRQHGIELYHEPSLWPLSFSGPTVMTVHDLCHVKFRKRSRKLAFALCRVFPRALERCERIITDTEQGPTGNTESFQCDPGEITTVPLGVSNRFRPACFSWNLPANLQPGGYFLCVGTLEPRKISAGHSSPCQPFVVRAGSVSFGHCGRTGLERCEHSQAMQP